MITSSVLAELVSAVKTEMPSNVKSISVFVKAIIKNAHAHDWNSLSTPTQDYLKDCVRAIKSNLPIPTPSDLQETPDEIKPKNKKKKDESDDEFRLEYSSCRSSVRLISVRGLIEMKEHGQMRIPEFQRNFIWSNQAQKYFLKAVLRGIPISSVMLAVDEDGDETRYLLDGVQRTETLTRFFKDQIIVEGKKFSQMPDKLRNQFLMQDVPVTEVRTGLENWPEIFHIINKGGAALTEIEMWRAIYHNDLMSKLEDLSINHTLWTEIYGRAKDKRYKGMYLLLRAVAMHFFYKQYQKPMNRFMGCFLKDVQKNPDLINANQVYTDIDRILFGIRNLGKSIFRTTSGGQINIGLVDCILHAGFIAVQEKPGCSAQDLEKWLQNVSKDLLAEPSVLNALTFDTSGNDNITLRMSQAENLIYDILEKDKERGLRR